MAEEQAPVAPALPEPAVPAGLAPCGRDARRAFGLDAAAWNVDTPIRLEMGRRSANVYFWQVDDPAWSERYRNPYLHLTVVAAGTQVSCAYDVVRGIAAASRT